MEIVFFERRINNHELKADPIFVLGHWRSGTTLMQHILMSDHQHTSSTIFTCILSDVFLLTEPWLKPIIRVFSNIFGAQYSIQKTDMDLDLPAELETAMVSYMSFNSYTWGHLFPTHFTYFLQNYTFKNDEAFLQDYHYLIKKISYASNGKRVIVKSPGDTGRLKALLKQYPRAKFIYLHRDLHDLYHSNIYLWQTILRENALKVLDENQVKSNIKNGYKFVLTNYANQRKYIPPIHLAEINFEDLITETEQVILSIYNQFSLGIPDIENMSDVIKGIKEYKQQVYTKPLDMDSIDEEMVDLYRSIKPDQNKDE